GWRAAASILVTAAMGEEVLCRRVKQGRSVIDGRVDIAMMGKRIASTDREARVGVEVLVSGFAVTVLVHGCDLIVCAEHLPRCWAQASTPLRARLIVLRYLRGCSL